MDLTTLLNRWYSFSVKISSQVCGYFLHMNRGKWSGLASSFSIGYSRILFPGNYWESKIQQCGGSFKIVTSDTICPGWLMVSWLTTLLALPPLCKVLLGLSLPPLPLFILLYTTLLRKHLSDRLRSERKLGRIALGSFGGRREPSMLQVPLAQWGHGDAASGTCCSFVWA